MNDEQSSPRASTRPRYLTGSSSGEHELDYSHDTPERIVEELRALEAPPTNPAPCSFVDICKREAKHDFAAERHASGLGVREAARLLKVDESLIRAWEDERDMRRHPPKWATHALGRHARIVSARRLVDYLRADVEVPSTGTTG